MSGIAACVQLGYDERSHAMEAYVAHHLPPRNEKQMMLMMLAVCDHKAKGSDADDAVFWTGVLSKIR